MRHDNTLLDNKNQELETVSLIYIHIKDALSKIVSHNIIEL